MKQLRRQVESGFCGPWREPERVRKQALWGLYKGSNFVANMLILRL